MSKKTKKLVQTEQQYDWEASEDGKNVEFVAEGVRIAFTKNGQNFFEPEEYKKQRKFKGQFIIEDEDVLEQAKEILQYLVVNNVDEDFDVEDFEGEVDGLEHIFLRNGDKNENKNGEVYDGFAGNFYIAATRSEKQGAPTVFADTGDEIEDYPDARVFKDGCYANVALRAYYSEEWEMIGCNIEAVIYTEEGEPFTGDNSYSTNEDKKKKLFGKFKPKQSKAKKVFGKKKKKSEEDED